MVCLKVHPGRPSSGVAVGVCQLNFLCFGRFPYSPKLQALICQNYKPRSLNQKVKSKYQNSKTLVKPNHANLMFVRFTFKILGLWDIGFRISSASDAEL